MYRRIIDFFEYIFRGGRYIITALLILNVAYKFNNIVIGNSLSDISIINYIDLVGSIVVLLAFTTYITMNHVDDRVELANKILSICLIVLSSILVALGIMWFYYNIFS